MAEKLKLDIPVLLPDMPAEKDCCIQRLIDDLQSREGVAHVHLVDGSGEEPARLCIHYEPDILPLPQIRSIARRAGAELTDRYGHLLWRVRGIPHPRRARSVSARLLALEGVVEAEATSSGALRIEYDRNRIDAAAVVEALGAMGVRAQDPADGREVAVADERVEREHRHAGAGIEHMELRFAILAGAFLAAGWGISTYGALPAALLLACYATSYFFGGFFAVREALDGIRTGRFEIDFLMLVAATGAAVLGEWAEGALLLTLFSLGHALEHYAMGRARKAIEALSELAPETARVLRNDAEVEIPVEELVVGDLVVVRPSERIPADGFVSQGTSSVNQAPVTGESIPVDKQPVDDAAAVREKPDLLGPEHRVFAGSINGNGALQVEVLRRAEESVLSRIVQLVAEAETRKSPTQRLTDRFERVFVPAVLVLDLLLLFAWLVIEEPFGVSFYRAMAVLVAASPCALAISTPSAVLSAVARAGREGVLVKGGGPLEQFGAVSAIAFDKTGTLTAGRPRVTDLVLAGDATEEELLSTAAAVERLSDHPLADAVVRYASRSTGTDAVPVAREMQIIVGHGIQASLDGRPVFVGKEGLFAQVPGPPPSEEVRQAVAGLEVEGRTTMVVRLGDRYLGVLGLMDTPREEAADVVSRLRGLGIRRMIIISGDNQRVVDSVAAQIGLDEAYGDLLPDQKVDAIRDLQQQEPVAMIGDGVNDAPAMARATVGVAMGAAGSDAALETADVALMADALSALPFALALSRKSRRIIQQNLWISLGMVVLLIPAAILGFGIGPTVALHEGSTLVVVANALRLLGFRSS